MYLPKPKISNRMKVFIDFAKEGQPFWDVCCDHGYVGLGAMQTNRFSKIHFVDQVPHIMQRLNQLITQSPNLQEVHQFKLHVCGGEDIDEEVFGTLLIAGVGGTTIKKILDSLMNKKYLKAERLLLSPHMDEHILKNFINLPSVAAIYKQDEVLFIKEGKRERPLYVLNLCKNNFGP